MDVTGSYPETIDPGSMLAAIPTGACLLDARTLRVIAHNQDYQKIQREPFRSTGVVGLRLEEHLPEAEQGDFLQSLQRAASGEPVDVRGFRYPHGSQDERYWDVHLRPLRDLSGRIQWVLATLHDVTDDVRRQTRLVELDATLRTVHAELSVNNSAAKEAEERETAVREMIDSQRQLFQAIIDHVPAAIAVVRPPDFTFDLANQACQVAANCEGMIGRPLADVWPELAPLVLPVAKQAIRTGKPSEAVDILSRISRKPGAPLEDVYFRFSTAPLQLPGDQPEALFVLGVETTEHVLARHQITELAEHAEASLRQLEAIVNGMADGLMIVNSKGHVTSMNPAALKMNGFDTVEESRRHWRELADLFEVTYLDGRPLPIEDWPAARALRGETFTNLEIRTRRRDTGRMWIASYGGAPVHDNAGEIILAVITSQDVTEEKKADEDQRFLAEVSRVLVSSLDYEATLSHLTHVAIPYLADSCLVDMLEADGSIRRLCANYGNRETNEVAGEMQTTGWISESGPLGPGNVIHTGESSLLPQVSDELLKAEATSPERLKALRSIGLVSTMTVPLTVRGKSVGAVTFISTESGRHFDQADLRLAQEVARRAAICVDNARLYREAQQAIRSRDEFLSVAAHELKTPVTSLRGFAQLAIRRLDKIGELDPQADRQRIHRALEVIDQQSNKLSRLISQLLDVSRIEGGKLVLNREVTDVTVLVQGVVAAARAMTHRHIIHVSAVPKVEALLDPLRFEQVVTNLIDNAIKYSPGGGQIDVEISKSEAEMVRVVVRDRGFGIPPEHRHQIFDRFYQAHADSYSSGVGLGLFISRQIIGLHGGEVEAEFPDDGGTRFVIQVPTGLSRLSTQTEGSEL